MSNLQPSATSLPEVKRLFQSRESEIGKALGYVFLLLGFSNSEIPTEMSKAVLLNFIKTSYPHITIDDIKLAILSTAILTSGLSDNRV